MGEHWLIVGVAEVSFYIENLRWSETQLMVTTK